MSENTGLNTHAEVKQESGNPLLSIEPGMVIWTWVVFILLFAVLWKFGWKPILSMLDEREKTIKDAFEGVENARKEMKETEEKERQILIEAKAEANKILHLAEENAQAAREAIRKKGESEYERMIDNAKREIDGLTYESLRKIRKEAVDLAIIAAEKVLKEKLDQDKDRKLVERFVNELAQEK